MTTLRAACVLMITLVACAPRAPGPGPAGGDDPPHTGAATRTEAGIEPPAASRDRADGAASQPAREKNIYIDSVKVGNPVVVTGRARTFENNVVLRLRTAGGELIREDFTTSVGEMGTHSRYSATLWVTRDPGPRILVDALEYSAKDGSEQSLVTVSEPYAVELIDAELHFPDAACTTTRPYVRKIPKSVSMARLLVEALIAGPTRSEKAAGAAAPFPRGSRVESVNLRDGVLTVDFNDRLRNVGGACRAQMIRAAVTETLKALPSVRKVVITAAGSESLALQP